MNGMIFDRFEMYYPSIAEQAVSWEQKSNYVIFVTLSDGSIVEYNDLMNSFRTVVPYDGSEESWKREFAHRPVELMGDRGFDESYLCEASGVSQQSISNYIHRKTMPTGFIIDKLARALGCDVSELTEF